MELYLVSLFLTTFIWSSRSQAPVIVWHEDSLLVASSETSTYTEYNVSNKKANSSSQRQILTAYDECKAMTYDPATNALYWTAEIEDLTLKWANHIFTSVNNSGVIPSIFSSPEYIYGLAIDSDRKLLFITTAWDKNTVGVMDTRGDNYRIIAHVQEYCLVSPYRLVLDTRRDLIYVACHYRLLRMDYDGQEITILASGERIWDLALDERTNTLYYADNTELMSLSAAGHDNHADLLMQLDSPCTSIALYGSHLFLGYEYVNRVDILDTAQRKVTATILTSPEQVPHWWSLVTIPPT